MNFDPLQAPGWQQYIAAMGLTLVSSTSQDTAEANGAGVVTKSSTATYNYASPTQTVTIIVATK